MRSFCFFALILMLSTAAFAGTVAFSYGDGSTLTVTGTLNGTLSGGIFTATRFRVLQSNPHDVGSC